MSQPIELSDYRVASPIRSSPGVDWEGLSLRKLFRVRRKVIPPECLQFRAAWSCSLSLTLSLFCEDLEPILRCLAFVAINLIVSEDVSKLHEFTLQTIVFPNRLSIYQYQASSVLFARDGCRRVAQTTFRAALFPPNRDVKLVSSCISPVSG